LQASRTLKETNNWVEAFQTAISAITTLGGAKPGDRTMLDALQPASDALQAALRQGDSQAAAWTACLKAAEDGVAKTATMRPRLGRASYMGDRAIGNPDAGAAAVNVWLKALTPHITG
jgi:dihydroxyacetone kinase